MRVFSWWWLLTALAACSSDSARRPNRPVPELPAAAVAPARPVAPPRSDQPPTEVYIGLIGPYPVVLGLSPAKDGLSGQYYYLRQADTYQQQQLAGERRGDSLRLTEFDAQGRPTHTFRGHLGADGRCRGRWRPYGAGPALPFVLRRQPRPDYEQYRQQWQQALAGRPAHAGWRLDTVNLHVQQDTTGLGPPDPGETFALFDPRCHLRIRLSYARLRGGPAPLRARLNALLAAEAHRRFGPDDEPVRIRPMTARDTAAYCQYEETMVPYVDGALFSYDVLSTTETAHGLEQRYWSHRTLRLPELRPFRLTELLRGDFRAVFRRYARQAAIDHLGPDQPPKPTDVPLSDCWTANLRRLLLARVDTLHTTTTVLVRPEGLQIMTFDPRDVGCPPLFRGPYPLLVPYADLRPYIRPDGPLARVAAAQAARLRRVEAPFRVVGR